MHKTRLKNFFIKIDSIAHHILILFAVVIAGFNFLFTTNAKAGSESSVISIENLLSGHNNIRTENKLGKFRLNTKLIQSAQTKADLMMKANCWSHYCPDGKSPWDFFDNVGYNYIFAGENLAEGFYTIEDLMRAWMNSPTHKENILKTDFDEIGFGIAYGNFQGLSNNILVVVHFGKANDFSTNSQQLLEITQPKDGDLIQNNSVDVKGKVVGFDQVQINYNGQNVGKADIGEGIFTYRLNNLKQGTNKISAVGTSVDGTAIESSKINFEYKPGNFSISYQSKEIVNIIFIAALLAFFAIDFVILSKLNYKRTHRHYHFGLLFILVMILMVGGFTGGVGVGISF